MKFIKRWYHKLFKCPTFWTLKPKFTCPGCGKKYRCYWDGNDIKGLGKDYCNSCTKKLESKDFNFKKQKSILKILKWPEDKQLGLVPWFVVLWRIPWFGLIYCGISIAYLGVLFCYGSRRASEFWHSVI
jgi:hypothetical protein